MAGPSTGCPNCGSIQGVILNSSGEVVSCRSCERIASEARAESERRVRKDEIDKAAIEAAKRAPKKDAIDLGTKIIGAGIAGGALWNALVGRKKDRDEAAEVKRKADESIRRYEQRKRSRAESTFTRANLARALSTRGLKYHVKVNTESWDLVSDDGKCIWASIVCLDVREQALSPLQIAAVERSLGMSRKELHELIGGTIGQLGFYLILATTVIERALCNSITSPTLESAIIPLLTALLDRKFPLPLSDTLNDRETAAMAKRSNLYSEKRQESPQIEALASAIRLRVQQ